MGKSPGKWIKTILFGKKSSKSSSQKISMSNAIMNACLSKYCCSPLSKLETEKFATSKVVQGNSALNAPTVSDIVHHTSNGIGGNSRSVNFQLGALASLPANNKTANIEKQSEPATAAELARQEQAAIKSQAICRGYLARRAYHALKGVVRLQALVRGILVRRQAVATLRCMQGIVRLQAHVRGRRVRQTDAVFELQKKYILLVLSGLHATSRQNKLSSSAFICKLLASSTSMPLCLHYDTSEPNSAWNWLERWSLFHFWGPLPELNKALDSKSQTQKGNIKSKDLKQVERKVRVPNGTVGKSYAPSYDKPVSILRKPSGHQEESGKEQHLSELERVKQNLKKIAAFTTAAPNSSDFMTEKSNLSLRMVPSSKVSDVPQKGVDKSFEKMSASSVSVSKSSLETKAETPPKPLAVEEKIEMVPDEHVYIAQIPNREFEEVKNIVKMEEDQNSKDDKTTKDYQRSQRRSLLEKQEYPETISQHNPTLPNYMQATESAKAKLRGFASASFDPDGVENGFATRRHSLPLYNSGKRSSMSPRKQSVVQASGRAGEIRMFSTDFHDKGARPGWRR